MGPGNMVSDGSLGIILLFCSMGIWGNGYWNTVIIKDRDLKLHDAFNIAFTIVGIINILSYS